MSEPSALPDGVTLRAVIPSGDSKQVVALAWSCDGRRLAAAGPNGCRVWDVDADGSHRHAFSPSGNERLFQVVWSPVDPDVLVHASTRGINLVRVLPDGGRTKTLWRVSYDANAGYRPGISFAPDGRSLVVADREPGARILDAADGRVIRVLNAGDRASAAVWSSAGILLADRAGVMTLVVGPSDSDPHGTLKFWEFSSGDSFGWAAGSPDGRWAGVVDGRRILILEHGEILRVLEGHIDALLAVEFSHDGRLLHSVGIDGTLRMWRTDTWQEAARIHLGDTHHTPGGLAASPVRPWLARRTQDRAHIELYEIDTDRLLGATRPPSRTYANAKVVLLGDSGVGKSGLSLVLTGQPYAPTDSTHAREVRTFDDQTIELPDGGQERHETFLWDLAGQPGYRLIHQLHLAEVAAALIVFDARSETDPFAGVRYWARALRQHTGGAAVPAFLVAARADRGGVPVTRDRIDELSAELGLAGYFQTSAKEGRQIAELAAAVRGAIDWTTLPRSVSTELFETIKQFLRDERAGEQVLTTADDLYRHFLAKHPGLASAELRPSFDTCVRLLELRDLVRRLSFGGFVLLRPELLDSYASALIDAARSQPDGLGFLSEEAALAGVASIPEEHRLPGAAQRLLLIATVEELLRHDVALREPTDGGVNLIFPSQLTADRPAEPPGPGGADVVFRFDGAVQTLYAILAVRLAHVTAYRRERMWRNACAYRAAVGGVCGLRVREVEEGRGELTVFFDGEASEETRFVFEEYVRAHLETRALPGSVERRRVFACPRCGYRLPADLVRRRQERGDPDMVCPDCERVRVSLLDRRDRLDRAAKVRDMNASADAGRDRAAATATIRGKEETEDYDVFLSYNSKDRAAVRDIAGRLRDAGLLPWFDSSDLPPGGRWQDELERQIGRARSAAVFVAAHGLGRWQALEQQAFVEEHTRRAGFRIVPVLLPGAPTGAVLPRFLAQWNAVDFRVAEPDPFDRLRWAITGERPVDAE